MKAEISTAIHDTRNLLTPREYVIAQNRGHYIAYDTDMGFYFPLDVAVRRCEELNGRPYRWDDESFDDIDGGWFVVHRVYYNRLAPQGEGV